MAEDVFKAATLGIPIDDLEVHGLSVDELADVFLNLLAEANNQDYENVLNHDFAMIKAVIL